MFPEERRCARCGAEVADEEVESESEVSEQLDRGNFSRDDAAETSAAETSAAEDHQTRFARIVRAACDQLEELVERRGTEQLEEMAEKLDRLEEELNSFLADPADAGETKNAGPPAERAERSENRGER